MGAIMQSAANPIMPIPGLVDPVPVPRAVTPRADGRTDLLGLSRPQIKSVLEEAGLDAKAAKLRSKQLFHWLYHRGETDFEAVTDLAKPMRGWMAERFVVGRPQVGRWLSPCPPDAGEKGNRSKEAMHTCHLSHSSRGAPQRSSLRTVLRQGLGEEVEN